MGSRDYTALEDAFWRAASSVDMALHPDRCRGCYGQGYTETETTDGMTAYEVCDRCDGTGKREQK